MGSLNYASYFKNHHMIILNIIFTRWFIQIIFKKLNYHINSQLHGFVNFFIMNNFVVDIQINPKSSIYLSTNLKQINKPFPDVQYIVIPCLSETKRMSKLFWINKTCKIRNCLHFKYINTVLELFASEINYIFFSKFVRVWYTNVYLSMYILGLYM